LTDSCPVAPALLDELTGTKVNTIGQVPFDSSSSSSSFNVVTTLLR